LYQVLRDCMGIDKLLAIEVDHCPQSYGCLIVSKDGSLGQGDKLIYSGDTLPCTNFINYAQGAAVLIHEATLGSDMQD